MCAMLLAVWLHAQERYNHYVMDTREPMYVVMLSPIAQRAAKPGHKYSKECE